MEQLGAKLPSCLDGSEDGVIPGVGEVPGVVKVSAFGEVSDVGESSGVGNISQVGNESGQSSYLPADQSVSVKTQKSDVEEAFEGVQENALSRGNDSHWLDYGTLMGNTLPSKSKVVYMKAYSELETYLRKENQFIQGVIPSEHCMLNYFFFLKNVRQLAPSTIWFYIVNNITY